MVIMGRVRDRGTPPAQPARGVLYAPPLGSGAVPQKPTLFAFKTKLH